MRPNTIALALFLSTLGCAADQDVVGDSADPSILPVSADVATGSPLVGTYDRLAGEIVLVGSIANQLRDATSMGEDLALTFRGEALELDTGTGIVELGMDAQVGDVLDLSRTGIDGTATHVSALRIEDPSFVDGLSESSADTTFCCMCGKVVCPPH